jgi:hypothetical protein
MKWHERLAVSTALAGLWMLTGCRESGRETPPPKPPPRTTNTPQAAATTRPAPATMPFAMEPHSGMMMPPGHPTIGGEHGMTAPPVAGKPLRFTAPATWKSEAPSSSLRVAQYRVPRATGDTEDGVVVVSTFPEMRGMTQMNVDRWIAQFGQPDSRPSKNVAKVTTMEVAGMKTTILRITGTYENHTGWAMCAADIETPEGPWFVKMTGPEKTIKENETAFDAFVRSARE